MSQISPSSTSSPAAEALRDALERRRGRASDAGLCVVRVPAPARPAERLFALAPELDASYWAAPNGLEAVGLGAAAVLSGSGSERFAQIAAQAEALLARGADDAAALRFFGGFAFQPGRASTPAWQPFGEARFVLPRVAYQREREQATLGLVLTNAELADAEARARTLELCERLLAALELLESEPPAVPIEIVLRERPDSEFLALVEEIQAAIGRSELEKLVLARRVEAELPVAVNPARVLRRLGAIAPECARFAFRSRGATFLGATPERLVAKRGAAFETEALAGSIGVADALPGRLMENQKERAEQAIVVRELLKNLTPVAATLEHAAVPEIQRLRHVAHLRTRIRGELRAPLHVLELVAKLHPTPAVGGVPTARALTWIAEREPDERGWYAGPVGHFDARGDGEFAVALRSGLFADRIGALYAGAGVMRGSSAASELCETRWKLAALLGALEVAP